MFSLSFFFAVGVVVVCVALARLGSIWVLCVVLRRLCLGVLCKVLVWFSGVLLGFSGSGQGFPRVLFINTDFNHEKGEMLAVFFYFPFCDSCVVAFFVSLLIFVLVVVRVVGGVSLLLLLLLLLWWKTIRSLHFALKCVYFV